MMLTFCSVGKITVSPESKTVITPFEIDLDFQKSLAETANFKFQPYSIIQYKFQTTSLFLTAIQYLELFLYF